MERKGGGECSNGNEEGKEDGGVPKPLLIDHMDLQKVPSRERSADRGIIRDLSWDITKDPPRNH